MDIRRTLVEALARFALFCGAMGLLRWGHVTWQSYQTEFSSSFEHSWDIWVSWIALLAGAGFVAGLACLPGRPRRYRLHVPLVITVPALLLLGHFVLLMESVEPEGTDLPWILGHFFFYMDLPAQFVLAVVAGFGIAGGFRPGNPPGDVT